MQTDEQRKGTKFEIWLELLLNRQAHQNVLRNVEYHKERYLFRQVDLSYNFVDNGTIHLAIIEAKYSSGGRIPYKLRKGEVKKSGQLVPRIDNLVDELWERQQFVGAHAACLVTNHSFDDQVKAEAGKRRIDVVEGPALSQLYLHLGGAGAIDDSINTINLGRHNLHKSTIYL
ncbi:hypothetical protein KY360_03640 [Candidatus Woesearchaeota archaeon]|nr:hypothetical protein [Candidatus Woesearchaeota archaeon]